MNYSELSDFEINKLVAEALGLAIKCLHDVVMAGGRIGGFHTEVDYCNNPSDAWPIILENKINIEWFKDGERVLASNDNRHEDIIYQSSNPLRAAMIVFLMMNEG